MNRKAAISAVIALTMTAGQPAFAQFGANLPTDTGAIRMQQDDNRGGGGARQVERRGAAANQQRDNRGFGRAHNVERGKGRGAGPNHEYYRGDRLPAEYRHRNYAVNDWRSHNLNAPPRGYQWVQSGGDYILIAVATGIIAQLLLDHR